MTYQELMTRLNTYQLALTTMGFDARTIAPKDGSDYRNVAISQLSGEYFALITSKEAIATLEAAVNDEDVIIAESAKSMLKQLKKDINIPHDAYVAFSKLTQESQQSWEKAKQEQDYSIFEDDLIKVIETQKEFLALRNDGLALYESALDDFEEGLRIEHLESFFKSINENITPFIDKVIAAQGERPAFLSAYVSTEDQIKLSEALMKHLTYDKSFGLLAFTEHPFSSTFSINDSRITSHIHEDDFTQNIFSIIHEIGHSMYNHQVNPAYEGHALANNMSYSMHESQSRLLENMIGRSKAFWTPLYPQFVEIIPEVLGNVSLDEYIRGINYVKKDFIRIEADELTYPLHISVRYEVEKAIFADRVELDNLNTRYAQSMKDILGLEISNDAQGILQDIHWSGASFGYFPTYALGSAYAAQFMSKMEKDIDVNGLLEQGDLASIFVWLKENIHQYSGLYPTQTMIKRVSGETFKPEYYVNYLISKYSQLLGIPLD